MRQERTYQFELICLVEHRTARKNTELHQSEARKFNNKMSVIDANHAFEIRHAVMDRNHDIRKQMCTYIVGLFRAARQIFVLYWKIRLLPFCLRSDSYRSDVYDENHT